MRIEGESVADDDQIQQKDISTDGPELKDALGNKIEVKVEKTGKDVMKDTIQTTLGSELWDLSLVANICIHLSRALAYFRTFLANFS